MDTEEERKVRGNLILPQTGSKPNILITGTPGTGKSTTSEMVAEMAELNHINLSQLIGPRGLHSGRNEEFDCFILDEDKVIRCCFICGLLELYVPIIITT